MCFSLFCQANSQNGGGGGEWERTNDTGKAKGQWEGYKDVLSETALGYLHLSFEYHQTHLKIRPWQLSDLLLPPPQTSDIESVYVQSRLIPDKRKRTNRRTEEVFLESAMSTTRTDEYSVGREGIQHIITPSSFKFAQPFIYTGVTKDIVRERSVQLEVIMTQKHTRKPFLVALVHMPLRTAVRRPIREKYPLIPCVNLTIPNNMRVYSARDIISEDVESRKELHALTQSKSSTADMKAKSHINHPVKRFISVDVSCDSDLFTDDDVDDIVDNDDIDDGLGSSVDVNFGVLRISSVSSLCSGSDDSSIERADRAAGNFSNSLYDSKRKKPKKKKIIPSETYPGTDNASEASNKEMGVVDDKEERNKNRDSGLSQCKSDDTLSNNGKKDSYVHQNHPDNAIVCNEPVHASPKKKISYGGIVDTTMLDNQNAVLSSTNVDIKTGKSHSEVKPPDICITQEDDECSEEEMKSITNDCTFQAENTQHETDDNASAETDFNPKDCIKPTAIPTLGNVKVQTTNPTSRPETPIWDYYDFTADEEASGGKEDGKAQQCIQGDRLKNDSGSSESNNNVSPCNSVDGGTLQESLARLNRPQPVLDTCRAVGPVLPPVILDDFEMDQD